ncbi:chitosanase [Sneathiella chinensis]|uniref:Chitosanase n=1 Tax=Sneathiella chinensis TaxID=349750 RepID=A0ABQ5U522_9PROT|nr:chitosanase [Sneathiella chinensis]GLQ07262.1 hypothetical protein GCM10007924_24830 [Sneathiella chinensis]
MLTPLQKKTAQAIVNLFETGAVSGDYGHVTVASGDAGHLSYGRSQVTLASGNLCSLIENYIQTANCAYGSAFEKYHKPLEKKDFALDFDEGFRALLRQAGTDPVMQAVQDRFFDEAFWRPALRSADYISATTALGVAIIYDSRIHGNWHALRDQVIETSGSLESMGEEAWFASYVAHRRNWLATHSNDLLQKTVYRMESFRDLIMDENWSLALPLHIRGVKLSEDLLSEVA